jgi:hypothetical protein
MLVWSVDLKEAPLMPIDRAIVRGGSPIHSGRFNPRKRTPPFRKVGLLTRRHSHPFTFSDRYWIQWYFVRRGWSRKPSMGI